MMTNLKKLLFGAATVAFTTLAQAGDFLHDFETGKAQAAKEGKGILVKFTGSDWCPPCQRLEKEVFSKKAFADGVSDDFVVVVLDFPRAKEQSAKQKAANEKVRKKYGITGFPSVLLMDKGGKVFERMGYQKGGAKAYVKSVKTAQKARRFR